MPGEYMRVPDDLRRCVVFIGIKTDDKAKGEFESAGTAWLINYDRYRYLVTAKHVAAGIGDAPYRVRFNRKNGDALNLDIDPIVDGVRWYCHRDNTVDLAVMPFSYNLNRFGLDFLQVPESMLADNDILKNEYIGIGDLCYTVGLFRLLTGRKRNLPVVHFGSIAMMPSDELIPVRNWDGPGTKYVEGYLVETQGLQGLSGAPVFVRPVIDFSEIPTEAGAKVNARLPENKLLLLGIWQAAWDAPPDEVLSADRPNALRVPVGMGVVVPATKLKELLDMPEVRQQRADERKRAERDSAATPDFVPPTKNENPQHREDFNRLLDAATKGQKSDPKT